MKMQRGGIAVTRCGTYVQEQEDSAPRAATFRREGVMSEYLLALYVWSGVATFGLSATLLRLAVGETLKAVGYCPDQKSAPPPPSFPSRPLPSSPG